MDRIDSDWENIHEIIIFGYGRQAHKLIEVLQKDFEIVAVIDNDPVKKNKRINKQLVISSFGEMSNKLQCYKTIVCALGKNYEQIKSQLMELDLVENKDFMQHEKFLTSWYWQFRGQVNMLKTDIFVTSYCNLRCEKCASFIPYWKKNVHIDLNNILSTVDNYFYYVDFVSSMDIYGGEPLLYPELINLIDYIADKYRERIGYFGLITNGLVLPGKELLDKAIEYDLRISISDYSNTLGYEAKEKIDALCSLLDEYNISYLRNVNLIWKDLGFPKQKVIVPQDKAIEHRKMCNITCHNLYNHKLYFCAAGMTAEICGIAQNSESDVVELKSTKPSILEREILLDFANGKVKGEYSGFCNVCRGYGIDNDVDIKAAEQLKRKCI